jgi:hypothetical protein
MEVMDRYVAIKDMMQHMISSQHIRVSTEDRYMYNPPLLEHLHQVIPPPAKMPLAKKDIIEVEASDEFVFNKVQEEETKDEEWISKERKDRDIFSQYCTLYWCAR